MTTKSLHETNDGRVSASTAALTRLEVPEASNLLGTTSPLLNSVGFRVSCGCGVAVSEHRTGDALMRIVESLGHFGTKHGI